MVADWQQAGGAGRIRPDCDRAPGVGQVEPGIAQPASIVLIQAEAYP